MAPTYPSDNAAETFAGRNRYFRGRSGFLGSSTRAGHYGFFGPQTGSSGGGSNFFDLWARPQPRPEPRRFRPLIHRGRVFGKRVGVSLVAEYERGLAWRVWAARVGKFAVAGAVSSPAVDAVLLGWSLYQSYSRKPDRSVIDQAVASGYTVCVDLGGVQDMWGPAGGRPTGTNPCTAGVVPPVPGQVPAGYVQAGVNIAPTPNVYYASTRGFYLGQGVLNGMRYNINFKAMKYVPPHSPQPAESFVPQAGRPAQWVALPDAFIFPPQNPYDPETTPILSVGMDPVPLPYSKAGTGAAVGIEGSYGNGGSSKPPYFDEPSTNPPWQPPGQPPHVNKPPEKNEREGKARVRMSAFRRIVGAVYGGYTEIGDLVSAIYNALPSKLKRELWAANGYKPLSTEEKLMALWYSHKLWVHDAGFYGKAVGNIVKNQIQDAAIGFFPSKTQKSIRNNPYWVRPVGTGSGGRFTQAPRISVR